MSEGKANYRLRLLMLGAASLFASLFPLGLCLALNFGEYVRAPSDAVRLGFGAVLIIFLSLAKLLGKLRVPRRITVFLLIFILSYLFESVLDDMALLSGMALLGELLDALLFQRAIRRTREQLMAEAGADATAERVEEIIKKYVGRT